MGEHDETEDVMFETQNELEQQYAGWQDRVSNPDRFDGWIRHAAHLHATYEVPRKRACVVALYQQATFVSGTTIARILDISKSTVSEHRSAFNAHRQTQADLRDTMGPRLGDERIEADRRLWQPLGCITYARTTRDGERQLKLFGDRLGAAADADYLLIDLVDKATDYQDKTRAVITRRELSGSDAVIEALTKPFRDDRDAVGHVALLYTGAFDPDGPPSDYTSLTADRMREVAADLDGVPDDFLDALE